jgi:DNA polymerase-1
LSALYLIDVSALAYRSFFAFINNPLRNTDGKNVSAIFGFVSHTLRLIKECNPTHIAFVKDLPKRTFRHELYAEYKAHRKPMPDELQEQLPVIDGFVLSSGLRTVALEGFEADDVMATLSMQAQAKGMKSYIVTRDKDMMQLVGDKIFLFELGKANQDSLIVGSKEVKEKMGVGPEKIVDYLALIGDASDNVPGVNKVGPKGAADLLETYGTLENVYKNVGNITKKALRENLIADKENAFLSKRLVTLNTTLELPLGLDDLIYPGLDAGAVTEFLEKWEMGSLVKFVPGGDALVAAHAEAPKEPVKLDYVCVDTPELLASLASILKAAPEVAVDTETTGLDNKVADLVGICLSVSAEAGYYIPVGHAAGQNLALDLVRPVLKPIFDDPAKKLIFHNARYDLPVLERHGLLPAGLEKPGRLVDTMVAAYLANPGERKLSLDDLSLRHFGHEMIPIEALIGKGKQQISFAATPIADACRYGAEDADITYRLWKIYEKDLEQKTLLNLFFGMEMALLPVLMGMEAKGICIDTAALAKLSAELDSEISRLEKEIHVLAGGEFNIASPNQLQEILFEKLGLKAGKKTKTGYSTDADVLAKLEGDHPIVSLLLDHRECTKLQSTYVSALPTLVHANTGRVHTTYSQVIAATGRLSSVNPNLQNIPIRTELGRAVRRCFTASSPDRLFLCADYSQIELRLLAHLSGDPMLREAYRNGIDIHARTAAGLYKVAEDKVTADMRRSAKVVNFGVLYGMGAQRLSSQLKIPRAEASRFIENYFATYSRVQGYIDETVDKGRKLGYVETLGGRRRYLPELLSDNRMLKENAERIAANTPIQGSAADLIKIAMINIGRRLREQSFGCDMLLQVHDELVFEIDKAHVEPAVRMIKAEMEGAMKLEVPLVVEVGMGPNWLDAHS